jgi:hypothetical protein
MKKILKGFIQFSKHNPFTTLLIVVAAILHLAIIIPSGSRYCFNGFCGDYFWGVQEHDGIWHVAVAETAFKNSFSLPINPSFSGAYLLGYNILLDYIIFFLSRIGISSFFVYFKLLPIVWFILFTYTAIRFIKLFSKSKITCFVFLLLSYFGTSFGFVISILQNHNLDGVNAITVMQPILTLTNLQLAFSYISIMWVVIVMLGTKKEIYKILFISLFLFLSWGLKFYSGFLVSVIVGLYYLITSFKEKKSSYIFWLIIFFLSSLCSIIFIYNPLSNSNSSEPPFTFKPLTLVWPYIENTTSYFYSSYWANARYIFLGSSKISPRFLVFELLLAGTYLFFNLGMRLLGFFYVLKNKLKSIDFAITSATVLGILASLLLIQKGVWWNVVQFLYISSFLLNIYTALFISKLKHGILRNIFIILIIITSIPYVFDSIRPYISKGYNYVSDSEKKALQTLKKSKSGVIYSPLHSIYYQKNNLVNNLWTTSDNSYISAYSGQQMYLQVTGAILLSNDHAKREELIRKGNCSIISDINYVYFHKSAIDLFIQKCILKNVNFQKIYSSGGYEIYRKKI